MGHIDPKVKKIAVIVAVILAVVGLWCTDGFQKRFFSQKYWSKQVVMYARLVNLKEAVIGAEKLRMSMKKLSAEEIETAERRIEEYTTEIEILNLKIAIARLELSKYHVEKRGDPQKLDSVLSSESLQKERR
jgi:hypothetical protein